MSRAKPKKIEATSFDDLAAQGGHPLIGRGFHTVDQDGRTNWQGMICAQIGEEYFLCQLFEWFSGEPSTQHVFHVSELAHKHDTGVPRFRLFDTIADAGAYMETRAKHRDRAIDDRRLALEGGKQ